jgi:hypothetical protein
MDPLPKWGALLVVIAYIVMLLAIAGCSVTVYKDGHRTFFNENSD